MIPDRDTMGDVQKNPVGQDRRIEEKQTPTWKGPGSR
jgi:hypothetical protein